jgi:hypothetical protein
LLFQQAAPKTGRLFYCCVRKRRDKTDDVWFALLMAKTTKRTDLAPLSAKLRLNRVQLPTQRVKPETIAKLERMRPTHRGLGKAIDFAVEGAKE